MLVQLFPASVLYPIGIFPIVRFRNWNMKNEQVIGVESRIDALQPDEALNQQHTQYEQNKGEDEFTDHEYLSQSALVSTRRKAAPFGLQGVVRLILRGPQQRNKAEEQTRQQRKSKNESDRREIYLHGIESGQNLRSRQNCQQQPRSA